MQVMQTTNINISTQLVNLAISVFVAFLFFQFMSLLEWQTRTTDWHGVFRVFGGGSTFVCFLKISMYAACVYGVLDIRDKHRILRHEESGFGLNLLPLQDQLVLNADEVEEIKRQAMGIERQGKQYIVGSMVKKVCAQYRNDRNIGDTLGVFSEQMEAGKGENEGKLELVRYLAQTIPLVGFIGTISELSAALQQDLRKLDLVRGSMEGAFDATVVALTMTMVLTYLYHQYIGKLDVFYANVRAYITDNLISRIYTPVMR
jgi:hypothetical protein